jgi:uncharacterized protein YdeI (YjbR/CyaY-like superfamily)
MPRSKNIEEYISRHPDWDKSLKHLHRLISETKLEQTIKWGQPTYTLDGKNVLSIGAFKKHFGIWFFNGALLNDPNGQLQNAQEGKTKALRQLRFSSFEEMDDKMIIDFIQQAINNQKADKEVKIDVNREADIPPRLEQAFSEDRDLKFHFDELTPGRQREYAEYIATAKQAATKQRRLDKIIPMIISGIGLNDKYK